MAAILGGAVSGPPGGAGGGPSGGLLPRSGRQLADIFLSLLPQATSWPSVPSWSGAWLLYRTMELT